MDDSTSSTPATSMNIRTNPDGVGFVQFDHALSTSNARMSRAPPRTLTRTANISVVYPRTVAAPPMSSSIPGTPRKNLEYFVSYAIILRYLPRTAYEYSTERLTLITTRFTDTTGITFCITGMTLSSSSPSETITALAPGNISSTERTSAAIFSSAWTPRLPAPATVITSASYPRLTRSSYVLMAEKIAFESASSGSSRASLCAASMQASRPTTGVAIPAFWPTSSSRSTHITRRRRFACCPPVRGGAEEGGAAARSPSSPRVCARAMRPVDRIPVLTIARRTGPARSQWSWSPPHSPCPCPCPYPSSPLAAQPMQGRSGAQPPDCRP